MLPYYDIAKMLASSDIPLEVTHHQWHLVLQAIEAGYLNVEKVTLAPRGKELVESWKRAQEGDDDA